MIIQYTSNAHSVKFVRRVRPAIFAVVGDVEVVRELAARVGVVRPVAGEAVQVFKPADFAVEPAGAAGVKVVVVCAGTRRGNPVFFAPELYIRVGLQQCQLCSGGDVPTFRADTLYEAVLVGLRQGGGAFRKTNSGVPGV